LKIESELISLIDWIENQLVDLTLILMQSDLTKLNHGLNLDWFHQISILFSNKMNYDKISYQFDPSFSI
jgi:hypothetical protein